MRSHELSPKESYIEQLMSGVAKSGVNWSELLSMSVNFADQLGKGGIRIGAAEGRIVESLVRLAGCKRFVEIGTLTGYSGLWILQGMGDGSELITLEKDPEHARLATQVFQKLPAEFRVEIKLGDAREELKTLEGRAPFDGVFIDGNKAAYLDYLKWSIQNVRAGGIIIADNIFLGGGVYSAAGSTEETRGFSSKQIQVMREFNETLSDPNQFVSCVIPTSEGLFFAIKRSV